MTALTTLALAFASFCVALWSLLEAWNTERKLRDIERRSSKK